MGNSLGRWSVVRIPIKKPCGLSTAGLVCSSLCAKPLRSRLPNNNDANRRPAGGAEDRNFSRDLHAMRVARVHTGHFNHSFGPGDCQRGHDSSVGYRLSFRRGGPNKATPITTRQRDEGSERTHGRRGRKSPHSSDCSSSLSMDCFHPLIEKESCHWCVLPWNPAADGKKTSNPAYHVCP